MKTQRVRNILIIDDERSMADVLKRQLNNEGFSIQTASHGRQALKLMEQVIPELIITDIFMAEMDGLEVITAVRQRLPQVKIIAMSGDISSAFMNLLPVAQKMGADRTLDKPINFPILLQQIAELDRELDEEADDGPD